VSRATFDHTNYQLLITVDQYLITISNQLSIINLITVQLYVVIIV